MLKDDDPQELSPYEKVFNWTLKPHKSHLERLAAHLGLDISETKTSSAEGLRLALSANRGSLSSLLDRFGRANPDLDQIRIFPEGHEPFYWKNPFCYDSSMEKSQTKTAESSQTPVRYSPADFARLSHQNSPKAMKKLA